MLITKSFLRNESQKRGITNYSLNSVLNENQKLKNTLKGYDVFISHSFLDQDLILTLVSLFNDCGYSVYVDWINDSALDRSNVNKKTAKLVKERIAQSKCLAYVVTSNTSKSKWCPWELGVADGFLKGRASILPILDQSTNFKGQEYLGIYPHIDYAGVQNGKNDFWVNDPDDINTYVSLRSWISGNSLIRH